MRLPLAVVCALMMGCSATSFKVAPTTTKVTTKVATARRSVQQSQSLTKDIKASNADATVKATTTGGHIDAAMAAILARNCDLALAELVAAKTSNAQLLMQLEAQLRNVVSLTTSQEQTDSDLVAAEQEVEHVNKAIEEVVVKGAAAQAIVDEVNWGFLGVHIGALFYFFKSVLRLGFIGIVVLVVLGILLLVLGATVGGPFLKAIAWLWNLWSNRKRS